MASKKKRLSLKETLDHILTLGSSPSITVGVPMTPELRDRLKHAADKEGMALATWMRRLAIKAAEETINTERKNA